MISPAVEPLGSGSKTFARGIHPAGRKEYSAHEPITGVQPPATVTIPLLQHAGMPAGLRLRPRDEVTIGDVLAEADGPMSAPVHATINGVVGRKVRRTLPNGRHVDAVVIKASEQQPTPESIWDRLFGGSPWDYDRVHSVTSVDILERIRAAGMVGLGGAAFPTCLKLTPRADKPVRRLLINGCECEPYLTADARLMTEAAAAVVMGALLAGKASGASDLVIAVEDNKPQAIAALAEAAEEVAVRVVAVKTKYPMGGERQVIPAVFGRPVPTGGLPLDIGVAVINVSTAAAIAGAVLRHEPLTHRVISVTGPGVWHPRNLLAPIGMSFGDLIACCGGFKRIARRVIAGGPMMGFAVHNLDTPLTKGTSGIVVLDDEELTRPRETPCLRCGRCVDTCPLNLVPARLAHAVRHRNWDLARRYHATACMECGCCAYSCPAGIPLVQLIRTGKAELKKRSG